MDFTTEVAPTATPPLCDNTSNMEMSLHFSLIPAVLIIGALSFLQRRKMERAFDLRFSFLQRRFGIVIPMDIMSFSNRWAYGFAFGAIYHSFLDLIFKEHLPKGFPSWMEVIAYLIGSFEVALAYFPFFACLSTPFRKAGAAMGILYSIGWIIIVSLDWSACPDGETWGPYEKIIYQWPWMLSLIFLLQRFIFLFVKAVRLQSDPEQEEVMQLHMIQHVKRLLRGNEHSKSQSWFEKYVYEWDPHFKFPNRLIGTVIISLLSLYKLTLMAFGISLQFAKTASALSENLYILKPCMHFAIASSSLNMFVYICHVLVCYRKHMKRLWKGQRDFLPKKLNLSSASCMASIAKYSGWQIAYVLWGFTIICVVQCIVAVALVLPIKNGHLWTIIQSLGPTLATIALILSFFKLQELFIQYFCLQDKINDNDKTKPLALDNRNAFNCLYYFLFFNNVVIGVTSCILRIMTGLILGTWLVSRIDRSALQRGYERLDRGYCTWVGTIIADHHHNNPVMVSFCQLLFCHIKQKQESHEYSILSNTACDTASGRVRKRWRLFYTLLKNPHVIPLRKHHLCAKVPVTVLPSPQADIVVQAWLMRSQEAGKERTGTELQKL